MAHRNKDVDALLFALQVVQIGRNPNLSSQEKREHLLNLSDSGRQAEHDRNARDYAKLAASLAGLAGPAGPVVRDTLADAALAALGAESTPAQPHRWMAVKWFALQLRMAGDAAGADRWSAQLIGSVSSAYTNTEVLARQFDFNTFRAIEHWDDMDV